MLSVIMLSVIMLSVIMLSVIVPNVIMLSAVAPFLKQLLGKVNATFYQGATTFDRMALIRMQPEWDVVVHLSFGIMPHLKDSF
jgi:hypothetical protein